MTEIKRYGHKIVGPRSLSPPPKATTVSVSDIEAVKVAVRAAKEAAEAGEHFFIEFTP